MTTNNISGNNISGNNITGNIMTEVNGKWTIKTFKTRRMLDRRERMGKFGDAEWMSTPTILGKEVFLEKVDAEPNIFPEKTKTTIKCSLCGGQHWSSKCNIKQQSSSPKNHNTVKETQFTLTINNIPSDWSKDDLIALLGNVNIKRIKFLNHKNKAFVDFYTKTTLEASYKVINGKRIDNIVIDCKM